MSAAGTAVATSNTALQQIAAHEKLCGERFQGILRGFESHERRMSTVMKILWATAGGVIMTLAAAAGTLLVMMLRH
jgi:hypothetical protein